MNWKPGDEAFVAYSPCSMLVGNRCVVIAVLDYAAVLSNNPPSPTITIWPVVVMADVVGYPNPAGTYQDSSGRYYKKSFDGFAFKPEWLRRPDEWDNGTRKVDWSQLPWQPDIVDINTPPAHHDCRCIPNKEGEFSDDPF